MGGGDFPYIAKIDYLLEKVYDTDFYNEKDIAWAEWNLSHRLAGGKVEVEMLNIPFLYRYTICGRTNRHTWKDNIEKIGERFPGFKNENKK